jgi:hypothetical protein
MRIKKKSQLLIFVKIWSGCSNYQLNNDNSNGWWNDSREITEMVKFGFET